MKTQNAFFTTAHLKNQLQKLRRENHNNGHMLLTDWKFTSGEPIILCHRLDSTLGSDSSPGKVVSRPGQLADDASSGENAPNIDPNDATDPFPDRLLLVVYGDDNQLRLTSGVDGVKIGRTYSVRKNELQQAFYLPASRTVHLCSSRAR